MVGERESVRHTSGMITQLLRKKIYPLTLCPPLSVKERQGDANFRLFKTIPSKSEMASSVTLKD